MKKITKIGLSALCGSLASASAYAGALSVSGGATATWLSKEGTENGNPIGLSSGLTFSGSGEFDNGTTFTLTLTHADQDAYSAGSIVINTPSFGQFRIGGADGVTGIDSHDDKMPTAWEETDGTGLTIGHDKISGVGGSMNLGYKTPKVAGTTLQVGWSPRNNGVQNNDKASSGSAVEHKGQGVDVLLDINTGGLVDLGSANLFVGYSMTDRNDMAAAGGTNADLNDNHEEGVAGVIFTVGPVSLGGQVSGEWLGNNQVPTNVAGYRNVGYGVSFNVNDDLSLSYGENTSKKGFVSRRNATTATILSKAESFQVAYTMGGAALKVAKTSVDNQNYTSGTGGDREAMTFALSLAF
jgi:outer membrane protein OmpU